MITLAESSLSRYAEKADCPRSVMTHGGRKKLKYFAIKKQKQIPFEIFSFYQCNVPLRYVLVILLVEYVHKFDASNSNCIK